MELGKLKDPRAVEPLIAAMKDPDALVRALAAKSLGGLKDPRALARMILLPDVVASIGRFLRAIEPVDPATCTADEYASTKAIIETARDRVVSLGRQELGLVETNPLTRTADQ